MTYVGSIVQATSGTVRPHFTHDCERCQFVGTLTFLETHARDVYVCGAENSTGLGREHDTLILRSSDEGHDYESFPLYVARHIASVTGGGAPNSRWQTAAALHDEWVAAGEPELDPMTLGGDFFAEFTVAASGLLEESEDGESRQHFAVIGIGPKLTRAHVDHYVSVQYPETHCQHEHDCCANWYSGRGQWEFVAGTADRVIRVTQRSHLNI